MEQEKEELRRLKKIKIRRLENEYYQTNPLAWYTERFKGKPTDIDWEAYDFYKDHQWDGTPNPFKKMFDSLADFKHVAIESATGTGKTFLLPIVVYWFLDVFPDSLVITTAPKQSQLKDILWSEMKSRFKKFKRIRPRAEMFSLKVAPDGVERNFGSKFSKSFDIDDLEEDDYEAKHQAIGVVAGVGAGEESATKMQGFHAKYMLFIIEEAAGVPQPVMTAIKNTCFGTNIILAVGNPDSQTDSLHEFAELNHVQHIQVSAYDHPNVVGKETLIHGAVTKESIGIRKDEYGEDSNLFRSRVRGIAPTQGSDSLIHYDWIVECMVGRKKYVSPKEDNRSQNALGVDVANSTNGDMACCAWGKRNILWWLHEFQCPNANQLAHNLVKTTEVLEGEGIRNYHTGIISDYNIAPHNIGVDSVGVGAGCVNEFVDTLHYSVTSLQGGADKDCIPEDDEGKKLYDFVSMREQMYWQARVDLQNHDIIIDLNDRTIESALIKELTSITYSPSNRSIAIEKKENIKKKLSGKSPNMGDAFVYWNWVRKNRNIKYSEAMPIGYFEEK